MRTGCLLSQPIKRLESHRLIHRHTLAPCPITLFKFFDRTGVFLFVFFFAFFFASQKEKYSEYKSSSFGTYSLTFSASIPLESDGVGTPASGRLRGNKET